ncbi:MAG: hypothetical protein D6740_08755 [Alphaproteobacteria bacterium]|nr:MAG: hypothetical protein D6740_08755 [Alphaproteobacteria bacterium]
MPHGLARLRRWLAAGGGTLSLPVVLALLVFQTFGGCTCPDVAAHGMPGGPGGVMSAGPSHLLGGGAASDHGSRHSGPACSCCGAGLCGGVGLLPGTPALVARHISAPGVPLPAMADRPAVTYAGHLRPPVRAPPFSMTSFFP